MLVVGNLKNSQEIRCPPCWWFDGFQKFSRNPLLPMLVVGNLKNSQEIRCSPCWWFDGFQKFSRNSLLSMLMVENLKNFSACGGLRSWQNINNSQDKTAALRADGFQKFSRNPLLSVQTCANGWEICCCPCFFKNSPPAAGYDRGKCLFFGRDPCGERFLAISRCGEKKSQLSAGED